MSVICSADIWDGPFVSVPLFYEAGGQKQKDRLCASNPSLDLAFTIADFFGMTIEEIFIHNGGGTGDEKELSK